MGREATVGSAGRVCARVKPTDQPDAGNPHVRLDEGAPVERLCEDTQALPTERGSPSYGLATNDLDRALLDTHAVGRRMRSA